MSLEIVGEKREKGIFERMQKALRNFNLETSKRIMVAGFYFLFFNVSPVLAENNIKVRVVDGGNRIVAGAEVVEKSVIVGSTGGGVISTNNVALANEKKDFLCKCYFKFMKEQNSKVSNKPNELTLTDIANLFIKHEPNCPKKSQEKPKK